MHTTGKTIFIGFQSSFPCHFELSSVAAARFYCHRHVETSLHISSSPTYTSMEIALRKSERLYTIPQVVPEQPEAHPIHTLSKFHYLIHELYPSNHHSSQEVAIYGMSCHPPISPNPTTCFVQTQNQLTGSGLPILLALLLLTLSGSCFRPIRAFFNTRN